jgi:hypothetical protein
MAPPPPLVLLSTCTMSDMHGNNGVVTGKQGSARDKALEAQTDSQRDRIFLIVGLDIVSTMRCRIALMTKTLSEMKDPRPFIVTECTDTDYRYTVTLATVHQPPENRPPLIYRYSTIKCPFLKRPTVHRPSANRLTEIRLTVNRPTANRLTVNRLTVNRLTVNRLTVNRHAVNQPPVNQHTVNRPTVNRPTVNRPTVNQPTVNQPTAKQPTGNRLTAKQPTANPLTVNMNLQ